MPFDRFSPEERAIFRRLSTPEKIQQFLDDLDYDKEPRGPRCRSPRVALRDRTAHCMSGALVGAAALRMLKHPPLLLDFEAVRDNDHVLALFQSAGIGERSPSLTIRDCVSASRCIARCGNWR